MYLQDIKIRCYTVKGQGHDPKEVIFTWSLNKFA